MALSRSIIQKYEKQNQKLPILMRHPLFTLHYLRRFKTLGEFKAQYKYKSERIGFILIILLEFVLGLGWLYAGRYVNQSYFMMAMGLLLLIHGIMLVPLMYLISRSIKSDY